jgi:N-acetylglutamate synthase and related acetyltransferases
MNPSPDLRIRPADRPGDLGWIVERHGTLYAEQFGWNQRFEALIARIVADFGDGHDPACEGTWIAELAGAPAGCVLCLEKEPGVAQLRLLLVEPSARGHGVGAALVRHCVDFASGAGYRELVLWTNGPLASARRIYDALGFRLVEEEAHTLFGAEIVGQHLALTLTR